MCSGAISFKQSGGAVEKGLGSNSILRDALFKFNPHKQCKLKACLHLHVFLNFYWALFFVERMMCDDV